MKKILLSLITLCSMTAAWAGTGDGSKEHPYTGEWQATDMVKVLKVGDRLAYDCVIKAGDISILDIFLGKICTHWADWAMGNAIDETPYFMYNDYCSWNTLDERKSQTFIVTSITDLSGQRIYFSGYYSGTYLRPDVNGFVHVTNATNLKKAIQNNNDAKVRLMDDIYLSDVDDRAFCSTFTGILDGNGNTIWAARPEVKHDGGGHYARGFVFTHLNGATIKNVTYRNQRQGNPDWDNQAIVTQDAKNCLFDNITFDNVSVWAKKNKAGAVAGTAENCRFLNITVKNSDFTTDGEYASAVVGYAKNCVFNGIEVNACEATAHDDKVGGVVSHSESNTIENVDIRNSFFKTEKRYGGGIAGYSKGSSYVNCKLDDQSCVWANGRFVFFDVRDNDAYAAGIVAFSVNDKIHDCVNSALISADYDVVGGIVAWAEANTEVVDCLNTGMVIALTKSELNNGFYDNYKTKNGMTCVEKTYRGTKYTVRRIRKETEREIYGGIIGFMVQGQISRCTNYGSVYAYDDGGGIVGLTWEESISDCLSDFYGEGNYNNVYAFVGYAGDRFTKLTNCLNLTKYDVTHRPKESYFKCENVLSMEEADLQGTATVTNEDVWTGKAAILLGDNWEQNLGTNTYPTPTGNRGLYHTRTVDEEFGTACLPYALRSDDNISFFTFDKATGVSGDVELQFEYAETVPAGTPVLFVTEQLGEICIPDAKDGYSWELPQITPNGKWQMDGTFTGASFAGDDTKYIYYVANGNICNSESVVIPPYRAFLHGPNVDRLIDADDTTPIMEVRYLMASSGGDLGIKALDNDLTPHNPSLTTFTLMGTKAPAGYKGIVIENGRKVQRR